MLRVVSWFVCLAACSGVAVADVVFEPDYPQTHNAYRFELAKADGFDAEGVKLVLVAKFEGGFGDDPPRFQGRVVGEAPVPVSYDGDVEESVSYSLLLVRGELPKTLDSKWHASAKPLATLALSYRFLPENERAKGDNEAFASQVYTVVVTPALKGDALKLKAKKTKVVRKGKDGKTLDEEALKGKEIGRVLPRTEGLLGVGALLGLLGLGALALTRRRGAA